jgi:hypothetical protein
MTVEHVARVEYVSYHGGRPFRAVCPCGMISRAYATAEDAQALADAHTADPSVRNLSVAR